MKPTRRKPRVTRLHFCRLTALHTNNLSVHYLELAVLSHLGLSKVGVWIENVPCTILKSSLLTAQYNIILFSLINIYHSQAIFPQWLLNHLKVVCLGLVGFRYVFPRITCMTLAFDSLIPNIFVYLRRFFSLRWHRTWLVKL